jgi:hypothetical protein
LAGGVGAGSSWPICGSGSSDASPRVCSPSPSCCSPQLAARRLARDWPLASPAQAQLQGRGPGPGLPRTSRTSDLRTVLCVVCCITPDPRMVLNQNQDGPSPASCGTRARAPFPPGRPHPGPNTNGKHNTAKPATAAAPTAPTTPTATTTLLGRWLKTAEVRDREMKPD